jgi:hypothetical protein
MAQRDGSDPLPDRPSIVRVTVDWDPSARVGLTRLRVLVLAGLTAAGIAVGVAVLTGGIGGASRRVANLERPAVVTVPPNPRLRGVAQVAAVTEAYRFPLGCMGTTLTPQAMAGALRSRTGPCWRYGVFVTAVLRRVGGVWRLALEATSRSCPRITLPASVRAELAACRR